MNENNLIYTLAKEHMARASGLLSLLIPQTSGVGIGVKGLDGRYQLVNKAMETLLGKSAGQMTGMTDTELLPPEVVAQLQRSDQQIADGVATTSDELDLSINGVPIRCLWLKFPVLGTDARVLYIGSVMLDISRQEAAAEMRQSLERWRGDGVVNVVAKTLHRRGITAATAGGVGEIVSTNLVKLSWHSAYECGIALIDDEHRGLFVDANNLLAAVLSGRPADQVGALIDALINDVVQHFQDEEALITAAGYPGAAEHAAIHRTLVGRAATLANHFYTGTLDIGELFQFLAHDLVALHLLGADREFFSYL